MNQLKSFFTSHSLTSHSIALGIVALVGAYHQVPQFQAFVLQVYGHFGPSLKETIATAIALVGFYYKTSSTQETK